MNRLWDYEGGLINLITTIEASDCCSMLHYLSRLKNSEGSQMIENERGLQKKSHAYITTTELECVSVLTKISPAKAATQLICMKYAIEEIIPINSLRQMPQIDEPLGHNNSENKNERDDEQSHRRHNPVNNPT